MGDALTDPGSESVKIYGYALAAVLSAAVGLSDARAAEADAEIWTNFWAWGSVSGKLLVSVDGSLRFSDRGASAPAGVIRPLIGMQATKSLSLWTGYTYAVSAPAGRPDVHEHRAVQQIMWSVGKVGKGALMSRTRLETRWVDGRPGTGWRARQMLRFTQPIDTAKTLIVVQSEPFLNLNTTAFGQSAGLDQLRNFVGLNVPAAQGLAIEAGYMNRYIRRSGAADRIDHIASATAVYRF